MQADEYLKLVEVEDRMWYFRSLHAHVRRELSRLPAAMPLRVLDAGCGTGGLIARLGPEQPAWRWTGIDFMPMACEWARRRCPGSEIRQASITDLPFADQEFEAVVSADVICQVVDDTRALAEFARVLRPGGLVVINVPAYRWLWSYHDDSCETKHRYQRRELSEKVRAAGFTVLRSTHWNALLLPLLVAKRKLLRSTADTSDVKLYPGPVEALCGGAMRLEHRWLGWGGDWAWGSSVLVVGRKL